MKMPDLSVAQELANIPGVISATTSPRRWGKEVGLLEVEHRILVFYRRTLINGCLRIFGA
jgi:hypothetical protein